MLSFYDRSNALHLDVLRCLAIGMGLDEEYFTPLCDGNHQNLRLLHYPECERDKISAGGQKRGGGSRCRLCAICLRKGCRGSSCSCSR